MAASPLYLTGESVVRGGVAGPPADPRVTGEAVSLSSSDFGTAVVERRRGGSRWRWLLGVILPLALFGLWWLATHLAWVPVFKLPTPESVVTAAFDLAARDLLWQYIGISTQRDWATNNTMTPYVDVDVDGDSTPDIEVYAQNFASAQGRTDVFLAYTVDYRTGEILDIEPVNFNWGDVDTNVYDSDTILLPVPLAKLGVTSTTTSFPITYQVSTFSAYTGDVIDQSPAITYDAVDPALSVSDPLYFDQGGTTIPFTLGSDATKDTKALVLHLQGATGQRAEVVSVTGKVKATPPGKHHGTGSLKPWSKHWRLGSAGD